MKKIDFNDNWLYNGKIITLPHDAMLHAGRDKTAHSGSAGAHFNGGKYEYTKTFTAPNEWYGFAVLLNFGGVYRKAEVYVNENLVGACAYGYSEFAVDITEHLNFGKENNIRVTADNSEQPNSRWYSGGGIYRPVTLVLQDKIAFRGVKVTTLSVDPVIIRVDINHSGNDLPKIEILNDERIVASGSGNKAEIVIPNAKLWSDTTPHLYKCRVSIGGDEVTETFGIRRIEWSNKGLFVNGRETLLRGGCVHHDNGILGACSYRESEFRRVKILKEAGFNALRIAHNPASGDLLEACDYFGVYVVDETWDMWYSRKSKYDYALDFPNNYRRDIETMVQRDYNHPCVIMYSIGNEVAEPASEKGVKLTKELVALFHSIDEARAVTAGINLMIVSRSADGKTFFKDDGGIDEAFPDTSKMNSTLFNIITQFVGTSMNKSGNSKKTDVITSPCLDALDIAGYNYGAGRYPLEASAHPKRVLFGSETFPQTIVKNWEMVKKYPYLVGDFMWTAWDYLGETGLGAWAYTPDGKGFGKPYPWLLADCGAFDILGNPTGEVYLAQAAWGLLNKPIIVVQPVNHKGVKPAKAVWRGTNAIPSWSWQGCEGNSAVVEIYSCSDYVELFQNGRSLGKKRVKDCKAVYKVKYRQGELKAVDKMGEATIKSAAGRLKIRVTPENKGKIVYVKIELVGENGVVESNTDTKLSVKVENGELLGFGSANPRTEESFLDGTYTTYYGHAQAVVRAYDNTKLIAYGEGLDMVAVSL